MLIVLSAAGWCTAKCDAGWCAVTCDALLQVLRAAVFRAGACGA